MQVCISSPAYLTAQPAAGATFTDNFNRTDGNLNGSTSSDGLFTWSEISDTEWEILSNQAQCVNIVTDTFSVAITSANTNTDNYYVEAVISTFNRAALSYLFFGIVLRGDTFGESGDGYSCEVGIDNTNTIANSLYRWSDGTPLDNDATIDPSGGGTLRLEASGSNLTCKWNGTPFMSATDSIHAGGVGKRRVAITCYSDDAGSSNDVGITSITYGDL